MQYGIAANTFKIKKTVFVIFTVRNEVAKVKYFTGVCLSTGGCLVPGGGCMVPGGRGWYPSMH